MGRALEAADAAALIATLADDVTLRVAVHDVPFEGRGAASHILGAVLDGVLHHIEVVETIDHPGDGDGDGGTAVLMFRARVASRPGTADGLLVVRPDPSARIADLTVFLRPLSALQALDEEMGRRLDGPRPDGAG